MGWVQIGTLRPASIVVRNKRSPPSDYDRTISKSIEMEKKKEKMEWKGKGVAQLGKQTRQSVPALVVGNQYGSNMSMLDQIPGDMQMEHLEIFFEETGLTWGQMLGIGPVLSLEEVD